MGVFLGRVYEVSCDISNEDKVVVVDLEHNRITTSEDIPTIPEPEYSYLRCEIMKLLYPNVVGIDLMKGTPGSSSEQCPSGSKPWGQNHDMHLRFIFLKFFASLLGGYRNFIENTATHVFNNQAFLKKRSRSTNQPPDPMITQFIESQGFLDYLERGLGSEENSNNLLDKLQDAIGRGQNPMSVLPSDSPEPEIITISDTGAGISGSGAKYSYDSSPSVLVGKDSKDESLSPRERAAERERMVLDIKVKLQGRNRNIQIIRRDSGCCRSGGGTNGLGTNTISSLEAMDSMPRHVTLEHELMLKRNFYGLWLRLLKLGATDDPLSSFEYGTILALIESDAEGIGGSGFVECIREHIHSGWICQLTEEQFIAVKELLKTAITRATSRNDMTTVRDALEVSAEMYKKDMNNVSDYVQRHLRSLSIWEELRFWEGYFEYLMERFSSKSANYAALVTTQLLILSTHMAGLGLPDTDAWYMIETIAGKNNIGYKHLIKLRGFLSHIQQLCVGYWGIYSLKSQSLSSYGLPSPHSQDAKDDSQQPAEASGVGRSWVQSMFSRDTTSRANSFGRVRKWTSDNGTLTANENGTPRKLELSNAGQKKMQTNVRTLRGHSGAVTALHCVTRREVWDLVGDREDAGFFISGSTDCSVKIWDPSIRGSELRATLKGHTRTVRAISSDRGKIVSGSDDKFVLVWDKQTTQLLEELKGHDSQDLMSSTSELLKLLVIPECKSINDEMFQSVPSFVLVGQLCAHALRVANIWDIRAGRQMHKLLGHTKWIRSIRMVGDTVITGSDDWTARMWSVSHGTCDAVLACHGGPVLCVEYSMSDKGIITGSSDGLLRFWENEDAGIRCVKNVTIHTSSILSINSGDHWLGIGAADNSMSLFHRPQERLGGFSSTGSKVSGWQLYRTPHKTVAVVRCVASDLERKRICSGGRNGMLRLWDATINI
ncbi:hypothetical protein RJ639_015520 [Escallonia herrerae]|uniref:UDENN domain-containing protein n=1 Tax=Escallonia herrerae TaxID=1293975 RepID=A0AA89AK03_9ASTE|nr:hypothetical protein RJ639_015520 [Escallonia herrerae]